VHQLHKWKDLIVSRCTVQLWRIKCLLHVSVYAKIIFRYVNTKFHIRKIINTTGASLLTEVVKQIYTTKIYRTINFVWRTKSQADVTICYYSSCPCLSVKSVVFDVKYGVSSSYITSSYKAFIYNCHSSATLTEVYPCLFPQL